jgi:hypothetical protein
MKATALYVISAQDEIYTVWGEMRTTGAPTWEVWIADGYPRDMDTARKIGTVLRGAGLADRIEHAAREVLLTPLEDDLALIRKYDGD